MGCRNCGKTGRLHPTLVPVNDGTSRTKYVEVTAETRSDVIQKARAERYRMAHDLKVRVYAIGEPQLKESGTWFILIPFVYSEDCCS